LKTFQLQERRHIVPETKTLHDMFVDEIRDAYDAERQITKALPKMIKAATAPQLKAALDGHLKETRGQIDRLERVFGELGEKVRGKHCDGVAGILEEGKAVMEEELDDATMDACLIAAGQRVEHYEIAAYGTLVAWAQVLKLNGVVDLLQATLDEETAADEKLSAIAEEGVNQEAAGAGDGEDAEDDDEQEEAKRASEPKGNASTKGGRQPMNERRGQDGQNRTDQRSAPKQQNRQGQGNAHGRPASQLGKQVPANDQGRRLQNQPGRTGSRRADR
jgi:ferritin-like metal-binding protein YciE